MVKANEDISLDIDGDGVPDIILQETNGKQPYVSVKMLLKVGGVIVSMIAAGLAWLLA